MVRPAVFGGRAFFKPMQLSFNLAIDSSNSAFSRVTPSSDLYNDFPLDMILPEKSTSCIAEAASDRAVRGSRGMTQDGPMA